MRVAGKTLGYLALGLFCAASIYLAFSLHRGFFPYVTNQKDAEQDIYFAWLEGKRLVYGMNPYARILEGDMRVNAKYATYFPGFYLLSALSQLAGLREYPQWIAFWRWVFLAFHLGIAALLFAGSYPKHWALSVFGAAFWLFNRWTLYVASIAHLDPLALFFLVLSLCLLKRRPTLAMLAFSLSLGIKQVAVFLIPLYVIVAWREAAGRSAMRRAGWALFLVISVPLALSVPFLFPEPAGYCLSILFSATRLAENHVQAFGVDSWLRVSGLPARLPMLGLMAVVYWLLGKRAIGVNTCALLVMLTFVDFNSVLFKQYMVWPVPLAPLAVWDWFDRAPKRV